jgi:TolB protein
MRFFKQIILLLFIGCSLSTIAHGQQVRNIGEAIRQGEGQLALSISSSDPAVVQIVRRAFSLHGGIRLIDSQAASFNLNFESRSSRSVQLIISSGQPLQQQLSREIFGDDFQHAVLRACDVAVEATLASPGFFAGKIAFVGKQRGVSELYSSDLLFSRVRALTADRSLVTGPSWSADGQKLLYTTYFKNGLPDIYMMDFTTRRRLPIATYQGTNSGAELSPDGSQIVMSLSSEAGNEIYLSDRNGKNLRRVTRNKSLESSPTWSPDGSQLVFESDAAGKPQLYIIPASGGNMRRLPTNISSYCAEPSWNPRQPDLLVFTVAVAGGFQLALYDMSTRQSKIVTSQLGSAMEPEWLNDGRHILFTRRQQGRSSLAILDRISGRIKPLHKSSFGDASSGSFVYP